jgi:hypothetical protein
MSEDVVASADMSAPRLPDEMRHFLRDLGLVAAGQPLPPCRPLTGGVSSDIWLICLPGGPICIKRALPALKVTADWRVPVERSRYEFAWLRLVATILPDAVPPLVGQSDDGGMFATGFLDPASAPLWKALLLQGEVEPRFAAAVGDALGRIHAATADNKEIAGNFATDAFFHALRLDAYLLATARRHPDIAPVLHRLAETTASHHRVLVHGDVSPKNILVSTHGPVFLDAECAWYGDPAFDLAFCLNHLLLKRQVQPGGATRLREAFNALVAAYLAHVRWEPRDDLERRCAALLPGLFLARVDGKSPVEYITTDAQRDEVRHAARQHLLRPPARLAEIADDWFGSPARA